MPRGPLPNPQRRRRNAPTIPTTNLPASGRPGPVPRPPKWLTLGDAGKAWWRWAWKTPQAAAWAAGHEVTVARRAQLEDDLVLCRESGEVAPSTLLQRMLDIDDRLGLTPKAMAQLRWQIVADETPSEHAAPDNVIVPDRWRNAAG